MRISRIGPDPTPSSMFARPRVLEREPTKTRTRARNPYEQRRELGNMIAAVCKTIWCKTSCWLVRVLNRPSLTPCTPPALASALSKSTLHGHLSFSCPFVPRSLIDSIVRRSSSPLFLFLPIPFSFYAGQPVSSFLSLPLSHPNSSFALQLCPFSLYLHSP